MGAQGKVPEKQQIFRGRKENPLNSIQGTKEVKSGSTYRLMKEVGIIKGIILLCADTFKRNKCYQVNDKDSLFQTQVSVRL